MIKACARVNHPRVTEVADLENLAAPSSPQVWFDTEALEAHEIDSLDAIATTEQHSRTAFRSDVQVEPPEEVPVNSESITSGGTRKVESKFAVRNVTELVVDAGQQTDRGRETRSYDVDEPIRSVKSAGRIERLLRNKRSYSELRIQKGECAIVCDKQLCSFPTLNEQEPSRGGDASENETHTRCPDRQRET